MYIKSMLFESFLLCFLYFVMRQDANISFIEKEMSWSENRFQPGRSVLGWEHTVLSCPHSAANVYESWVPMPLPFIDSSGTEAAINAIEWQFFRRRFGLKMLSSTELIKSTEDVQSNSPLRNYWSCQIQLQLPSSREVPRLQ